MDGTLLELLPARKLLLSESSYSTYALVLNFIRARHLRRRSGTPGLDLAVVPTLNCWANIHRASGAEVGGMLEERGPSRLADCALRPIPTVPTWRS